MRICFATIKTAINILEPIRQLGLDYITPEHILNDVANHRLIVCLDSGRVVGCMALCPEKSYNYTAIKRFVVFHQENETFSRGWIIKSLLDFAESKVSGFIGATPFEGNPMERILTARGYQKQSQFGEYCFYSKAI